MSEHDVTQESANRLANLNAALADMAARNAIRQEHDRSVISQRKADAASRKYQAKFGWTEAQFAEYWAWKNDPFRKSEWEHLLDRERKRIKAEGKPRKNKRVKDMMPEDAKAHRKSQVREAVQRLRAKSDAATSGELLSDEELDLIAMAEADQAAPIDELADLLASLKAAEEAEEK
jgi:hypothetical protein